MALNILKMIAHTTITTLASRTNLCTVVQQHRVLLLWAKLINLKKILLVFINMTMTTT
jgi:hypothetical protein